MSPYDKTLGAMLLCSWFNCALFTIEVRQAYTYFHRYKRDSRLNKFFVSAAVVADIVGVTACCAASYLYTITNFGDVAYAASQPWPLPMYVIGSGMSATMTQTFLTLRVFKLTNNIAYPIVFFAIIAAQFGGNLSTAINVVSASAYEERIKLQVPIRIWLSCGAVVDILISAALVWILARTKTDFEKTGHILRRVMYQAVKTGILCSSFALTGLIIYSVQPDDNISVFFTLSLGRMYSISMLTNLNSRRSNDGTGRSPSSGGEASTGHGRSDGKMAKGQSKTKGIVITSHVVTHIDDERDLEYGGDVIKLSDRRAERSFDKDDASDLPNARVWSVDPLDQKTPDHSQVDLVKAHAR